MKTTSKVAHVTQQEKLFLEAISRGINNGIAAYLKEPGKCLAQWIKLCYVGDPPPGAMPDSLTTVLIYALGLDEPVQLGYHDGEHWRLAADDWQLQPFEVTHWAHLPEPPPE